MTEFYYFLSQYDSGNLCFSTRKFRHGAKIEAPFGMVSGYREENNDLRWDTVRLHLGVDRDCFENEQGDPIPDTIISPFNFDRIEYVDLGSADAIGSFIRLFNDEFEFEMRIGHTSIKDIPFRIRQKIDSGWSVLEGETIGHVGAEGCKQKKGTHVEIVSYGRENDIFEELLYNMFPRKYNNVYGDRHIVKFYRSKRLHKDWSKRAIMRHWKELKIKHKIVDNNINDYKAIVYDEFRDAVVTKYSSSILFNGMV